MFNVPLQLPHVLRFNRRAKSVLEPEETSVQRSHDRSAVSEAEDKRSASPYVMSLPSTEKYWFSPGPKHILYKVWALESTAQISNVGRW